MQPDFAAHSRELRCKGTTFLGITKEKCIFFIKKRKKKGFNVVLSRIKSNFAHIMEQTRQLVDTIIEGIQEKKGQRIVVADLQEIDGAICRYFVICQGNSPTQVDAITDSVGEMARKSLGEKPTTVVGQENAQWVAMDYGDVLVHIFLPDVREFYDLEHLWDDAGLIQIPDLD